MQKPDRQGGCRFRRPAVEFFAPSLTVGFLHASLYQLMQTLEKSPPTMQ